MAVGTHAHGRGADLLADSERQLGSPFRHAQPQLRRRIGRLRFGSLQNHPESLSHRRRLRDRTRNDPGRNLAGGLYRGIRGQRPGQQEHRFEPPDRTVCVRPHRERPHGLPRIDGRPLRFLPEIRNRRRQHAGTFLEGAALARRRPPRKEGRPRMLHHHGTDGGQHFGYIDTRRIQDSRQDQTYRRTHRRRHLHAGLGTRPGNHVQGRRLHQLHRRLLAQRRREPNRRHRAALGRRTADVLRQDGRSNPHADQCGRTLAPFQLGTRSGILFGRSPRFGHVPRYRRGRRRGARPFRRPRPLPAARHDSG